MILSRRSFLKMAGLTVVAAAGASMFTGCGLTTFTPVKFVAGDKAEATTTFIDATKDLNVLLWPGDAKGDYLKGYLPNYLAANGLKDFKIVTCEYKTTEDAETDKGSKYLEVTVESTVK